MEDKKKYKTKESDLIKEFLIAFLAVLVLIVVLSLLFQSPKMQPLSIQSYANNNPTGFKQVELRNILGQSQIENYGYPYNKNGESQQIDFFSPENIEKVTVPIKPINVFFLTPLSMEASVDQSIKTPFEYFLYLKKYNNKKLISIEQSYYNYISESKIHYTNSYLTHKYYPIYTLISTTLKMAKSGIFAQLLDMNLPGNNSTYTYNYQNKLLFLQGAPLQNFANKYKMSGDQWGILKETGAYPGPWWLGIYTSLYQIPAIASSPNADLMAFSIFSFLLFLLALVPILPIINKIPYYVPLYKLIWRRYYEEEKE